MIDLEAKITEARGIFQAAIDEYFSEHDLTAVCVLFSGGNDSTTLAHLFKDVATHAVHINTGIGIEKTRQFVRETCESWNLPLVEEHPPPGSTYEELVTERGFPGPGGHYKMYQRLKERGLRQVRRRFVRNPRRERVLFVAGRRRDESQRRANVPLMERVGSTVWVSPIATWTKLDLNAYRKAYNVPRNEVSDLIHMSGECLCGSFAKPGELDEIGYWFPAVRAHIEGLEEKVRNAGIPFPKCQWGWGGNQRAKPSKSGPLCSSCDFRFTSEENSNDVEVSPTAA